MAEENETSNKPSAEAKPISQVVSNDAPASDEQREAINSRLSAIQIPEPAAVQPKEGPIKTPAPPPWTLQQFFNGEIDLDAELARRFQNVPMLTSVKFRNLGSQKDRGVATLTTLDGAAQVIFDVDKASKVVQMSFTWGSMLTLRFTMQELSDMDRSRWLRLMQRKEGGLTFLWGPTRWEQDYIICISRKFFTNIYTFSPGGYEAAVRVSPDVMKQLLDWLGKYWQSDEDADTSEPPKLLTW